MSAYGRRMQRRVTAAVLAAVLAVGTAACGDDSGDGSGSDSGDAKAGVGLSAALGGVPGDQAGQTLTYWNVPEVRRLVARDQKLYSALIGFGIPEVTQAAYRGEPVSAAVGFDEKAVDTSVQIGSDATRLTGRFDVAAVTGAMKKRGWSETEADGAPLFTDEEARVTVSSTVRSTSYGAQAPLLPLVAPKASVAADPAHRAAVDCLGDDAYQATFYGKDRPRQLPGLTLFAIGARTTDDGASKERLCAVTQSADAAQAVAEVLRPKTAAGERFAGARIDVGDGAAPVVTMEWANSSDSGLRPGAQNQTAELPQLLMARR